MFSSIEVNCPSKPEENQQHSNFNVKNYNTIKPETFGLLVGPKKKKTNQWHDNP
jgi:hypothetical protein